ncbi:MAG: ATP-grasp domain-containing protein [Actinomyces sp.]|uniref:5-(carboxyamino)imidazole ribonucleotide synthase n=1 Tax=Actinomyces sp. TaxID=29317 RepID=UPI0026DADBAE|nr:ATP-grasp domain-containing protein [Actinomyces sp.]MDO4242203.1 ATP-grasp domain-containing protein [Actinomyces sp.]
MSAPILAVIGGGQLARMMHEEASALGIHLRALVEASDGSTGQVIVDAPVGAADDEAAVRALLEGRDRPGPDTGAPGAVRTVTGGRAEALTFEHEHQDHRLLRALEAEGVAVRPGPEALELARDKLAMRRAMDEAGLPQPAWAEVDGEVAQMRRLIVAFAAEHGWPVVLKTPRGGYDGHGVLLVDDLDQLDAPPAASWLAQTAAARALEECAENGTEGCVGDAAGGQAQDRAGAGGSLGGGAVTSLLVEQAVPFTRELAVLLARSPSGQVAVWPVAQTLQVGGMCAEVVVPAPGLAADAMAEAERIGRTVAERFGVTGVLAVEMFAVEEAGGTRLAVNELAMRPHNSGHWTQDGSVTSQFAQHMRAVLDLPLGATTPTAAATVMVNVIGGAQEPGSRALDEAMALDPQARIHLYGKAWRPGRKLGHVNLTVSPGGPADVEAALARARAVAAVLSGEPQERGR